MDSRAKIDFVAHLPIEISMDTIINHIDAKKMPLLARVSKTWQTLFTATYSWQNKLAHDFDMPKSTTSKALAELSKPNKNIIPAHSSPHLIYQRLARLDRKHGQLPKYVSFIYANRKAHQKILLACATDDVNYAMQIIPKEEYPIWLHISLFAGCVNVPLALLEKMKTHDKWDAVAASGNIGVMKRIYPEKTAPTIKNLLDSAIAGSLPCLKYLLDEKNKFGLALTNEILENTNGNACLQFLMAHARQYHPELISNDDEEFLSFTSALEIDDDLAGSIFTSNTKPAKVLHAYFPDIANPRTVLKKQADLELAALEGNLAEVIQLITKHKLIPNDTTLVRAIKSGNLDLVHYLLDPENQFNLKCAKLVYSLTECGYNPVLKSHLLPCAFNIRFAIIQTIKGLNDSGQDFLRDAHHQSPLHFDRCIKHILLKPELYGLKDDALEIIKKFVATINIENKTQSQPSENRPTAGN